MKKKPQNLTVERVEPLLHVLRGERIILDVDLACIYGVPTKRLNEQVKRNADRFPSDFLFQFTQPEFDTLRSQIATLNAGGNRSRIATSSGDNLKSQIATSKKGRGQHRKYLPFAFTEHGAIMAANVLNSPQAVRNLKSEIGNLQSSEAWNPPSQPEPKRRQIGFHATDDEAK